VIWVQISKGESLKCSDSTHVKCLGMNPNSNLRISASAFHTLESGTTVQDRIFKLPPDQLERELYEEVNEVLTRLGGKWNRSKGGHVFAYDPAPLVAAVLDTGAMPPKNPTAFFPTPDDVVDLMMEVTHASHLPRSAVVLEPSAGTGAIIKGLLRTEFFEDEKPAVHACECLDINRSTLQTIPGVELVAEDFMDYETDIKYDAIFMNPPFSVEGHSDCYIEHVLKAWSMLGHGGTIAFIVPPGFQFRESKRHKEFLRFVADWCQGEELGAGRFKDSGTGVNTWLFWGEKSNRSCAEPYQGWPSYHVWNFCLFADNERELYEKVQTIKTADEFTRWTADVTREMLKKNNLVHLTESDIIALREYYDIETEVKSIKPTEEPKTRVPLLVTDHSDESLLGGLFAAA
jgi:hypothetical protein